MKMTLCATALLAVSGAAFAGTAIDGANFGSDYGPALWSQNVGTQFGNNNDASIEFANGSEINALYGSISGTTLFLGVAGNLETNFNKLNIVLDYAAGGQNTLSGLANLGNLDGLTLYGQLVTVLGSLPDLDRARAIALAESVAGRGAEARLDLLLTLLDTGLARLARTGVTGLPLFQGLPNAQDRP